jgi:hypothetical protein
LLLGAIVANEGGKLKFFKPGRITPERVKELLALRLKL